MASLTVRRLVREQSRRGRASRAPPRARCVAQSSSTVPAKRAKKTLLGSPARDTITNVVVWSLLASKLLHRERLDVRSETEVTELCRAELPLPGVDNTGVDAPSAPRKASPQLQPGLEERVVAPDNQYVRLQAPLPSHSSETLARDP